VVGAAVGVEDCVDVDDVERDWALAVVAEMASVATSVTTLARARFLSMVFLYMAPG
jgi:hypothetical protein